MDIACRDKSNLEVTFDDFYDKVRTLDRRLWLFDGKSSTNQNGFTVNIETLKDYIAYADNAWIKFRQTYNEELYKLTVYAENVKECSPCGTKQAQSNNLIPPIKDAIDEFIRKNY